MFAVRVEYVAGAGFDHYGEVVLGKEFAHLGGSLPEARAEGVEVVVVEGQADADVPEVGDDG